MKALKSNILFYSSRKTYVGGLKFEMSLQNIVT